MYNSVSFHQNEKNNLHNTLKQNAANVVLIRQVADEYVVKATYKNFVYKNEIKHGENKLESVS